VRVVGWFNWALARNTLFDYTLEMLSPYALFACEWKLLYDLAFVSFLPSIPLVVPSVVKLTSIIENSGS